MDQWGLTDAIFTWPGHHWPAVAQNLSWETEKLVFLFSERKKCHFRGSCWMTSSLCNLPSWRCHRTFLCHSKLLVRNWCGVTQTWSGDFGKLGNEKNLPEFLIREENSPWDTQLWLLAMALWTSAEQFYVAAAARSGPLKSWRKVEGRNHSHREKQCLLRSSVCSWINVKVCYTIQRYENAFLTHKSNLPSATMMVLQAWSSCGNIQSRITAAH